MKKLSIEEKAKAYDEALERARLSRLQLLDIGEEATEIEHIFPELKESEDERMWKLIKKYAHSNISDMALNSDHITREQLESWLEKQGEQKPAWSEEDETVRNDIIAKLAILKSRAVDGGAEKEICEMEINWLKSLRPQNTWKPSDEQINALEKECIAHSNYELCRLLEQLKKLREE